MNKAIRNYKKLSVVERTKHDGAVKALKERISQLRHQLNYVVWDNISNNNKFTRLGKAMDSAENVLKEMRETFAALKKLEPTNC